jgi:hypothetical protein
MEGRIALCGSCRKTQRIPGGPSEEDDSSVSGLFREALAAFGEGSGSEGADAEAEGAAPASEADTRLMGGRKRSGGPEAPDESPAPEPGEPPSAVKAALEGGPEADEDSEEIDFAEEIDFREAPPDSEPAEGADVSEDSHATSEVRPPASAGHDGKRAPKREGKRNTDDRSSGDEGGPATKDALPVEYAAKVLEKREIEKAIRREGEPDSPAGAFEPKDVELHGNVMKFHCRCGKRISVPVDAGKTIGRCPQCGARLVVPKVSHAKLPIPKQAPEPKPKPKSGAGASKDADAKPAPKKRPKDAKKKARSDEARAENVRRATAEVADRLRKRGAKKGKGKGKGKGSPGSRGGIVLASAPARLLAAVADAALIGAVLVGSFFLLGGGEWTAEGVVPAAVLCVAAWCANRIVVQWIFGSSIGMIQGAPHPRRPRSRHRRPLEPLSGPERRGPTLVGQGHSVLLASPLPPRPDSLRAAPGRQRPTPHALTLRHSDALRSIGPRGPRRVRSRPGEQGGGA